MMSFKPDIENLNTVTDCLSALADINKSIGDIKFQLEYEPVGGDEWRHSAERALFVCKKYDSALAINSPYCDKQKRSRTLKCTCA